jgi:hypothetical protein
LSSLNLFWQQISKNSHKNIKMEWQSCSMIKWFQLKQKWIKFGQIASSKDIWVKMRSLEVYWMTITSLTALIDTKHNAKSFFKLFKPSTMTNLEEMSRKRWLSMRITIITTTPNNLDSNSSSKESSWLTWLPCKNLLKTFTSIEYQ